MTVDDLVIATEKGGVLLLTLNRPDLLNAWTFELGDRYFDLLDYAEASTSVRVVVVTGAGRAFCAGLDTAQLEEAASQGVARSPAKGRRMTHAAGTTKPIVAAINGACVGFGFVQALHCDVRFAAESATFATAFTRRGLNAEYGTSWLLPRIVGHTHAADLLLSGRRIDADEAARIGLVNWVVSDAELLPRALTYAHDLATSCSPVAMADTKRQLSEDWSTDRISAEDGAKRLAHVAGHRVDFREGVRSFLERRPPQFAPWSRQPSSRPDWVQGDEPRRSDHAQPAPPSAILRKAQNEKDSTSLQPREYPLPSTPHAPVPARLTPLRPDEETDELRALLRRGILGRLEGHDGFQRILVRNAGLYERLHPMIGHLLVGMTLPVRARELMILRIAWRTKSPYEWNSHVRVARSEGVTDAEIRRIADGPEQSAWSEDDRLTLRSVDELLGQSHLDDATWADLAARYSPEQLVELPVFVGAYVMLAYAHNSFGLLPDTMPDDSDSILALLPFAGR